VADDRKRGVRRSSWNVRAAGEGGGLQLKNCGEYRGELAGVVRFIFGNYRCVTADPAPENMILNTQHHKLEQTCMRACVDRCMSRTEHVSNAPQHAIAAETVERGAKGVAMHRSDAFVELGIERRHHCAVSPA
jgi:hypothetical protein